MADEEHRDDLAEFSRAIAHDINNLLCSIQGQAEIMEVRYGPDEGLSRSVASIRASIARGVEMTRKLHAFGAGDEIYREQVRASEVLEGELDRFRVLLPESMAFEVEIPDALEFFVDPIALKQVVTELLHNAREFSSPRGQVRLELFEENEGCCLRVQDDGPGFSKDFTEAELSQAFVSAARPGRGIGLAAIRNLIDAHGGSMRCFNDGGAVVECHFPPERSTQENSSFEEMSVWVVEDEPALLEFIVDELESRGYAVSPFSKAESLLQAYDEKKDEPDVLLLDVLLPDLPGPELLKVLSRRGFRSAVLWSSGFAADTAKLEFSGRSAFLQKPYSSSELCGAIEGLRTAG